MARWSDHPERHNADGYVDNDDHGHQHDPDGHVDDRDDNDDRDHYDADHDNADHDHDDADRHVDHPDGHNDFDDHDADDDRCDDYAPLRRGLTSPRPLISDKSGHDPVLEVRDARGLERPYLLELHLVASGAAATRAGRRPNGNARRRVAGRAGCSRTPRGRGCAAPNRSRSCATASVSGSRRESEQPA